MGIQAGRIEYRRMSKLYFFAGAALGVAIFGNYIESLGVKMADETENLAYEILGDEGSEACCPRCGKPYEDFSDLGCGYCDSRSAEWGIE